VSHTAAAAATNLPTTEYGWRSLYRKGRTIGPSIVGISDEQKICNALDWDGARAHPTAGRNQSHDLEVTLGTTLRSPTCDLVPGLYEVKRLSLRSKGKSADRRFKTGRRGETIYGRRDAEIKSFAMALEDFLDQCLWSVEATLASHDFIDQALQRRHGKHFHERLLRLANRGLEVPELMWKAKSVINGGVFPRDIQAGFEGLSGIFIMVGHIYTLVKPNEYSEFIGFDSGSAEGPKLRFSGVIPLETADTDKG
jgi:hypothetical protein